MDPNVPSQPSGSAGSGKKIALIVIIILIVLGLGWYFFSKKGNGGYAQVNSYSQNAANSQPANSNQPMSLKELMARGSQKCDVSFQNANSQSQGTVYVGDGKFRGDFSASVDNKTTMSHMINDGQNSYIWTEGMSTGFKMAVSATMNTTQNKNSNGAVDPNAKYNYQCSSWSTDNSQFTPPANITFSDMSAMMAQPTPTGSGSPSATSMKAQQCAVCNSAGANKAQCLAALQCP